MLPISRCDWPFSLRTCFGISLNILNMNLTHLLFYNLFTYPITFQTVLKNDRSKDPERDGSSSAIE